MEEGKGNRGYPAPIRPGSTRIGWIGVGVMGAAMAARLEAAGYDLAIYARTASKASGLQGRLVASPAAAAASSDVVFTMVGHPSDVQAAILDPVSGALATLPAGGVLVDCTSSDPALAVEIAVAAGKNGCFSVDAPVSGGDVGARDGKLAILAGGEREVVNWLSPIFDLLGKATWLGAPGSGQSGKIANQIAVAGSVVGVSESLLFARKARLDEKAFLEAVRGGAAGSKVMEIFGERILDRDFKPGGFAEYMVKDLGMGLERGRKEEEEEEEEGEEEKVVLPGAALFQQLYLGMVANGDGKMGMQGLITVFERMNGIAEK